jgi:flavin-dependent dehydrogenase
MGLNSTDAYVVGGGPAGLAAAIALRLKGLRVMVADASRPPIDKACGEGLMPDALLALANLGVELDLTRAREFRGIRFIGDGESVAAEFPSRNTLPRSALARNAAYGYGVGVRRTVLHEAMIARAEAVGVQMRWGTVVKGLSHKGVVLADCEVACNWVIGADGENSRVRRWAGLDVGGARAEKRFGFRRHYRVDGWRDPYVSVYWGAHCQVYVTPVGADEVSVAALSRDPHRRLDSVLREFPELRTRLEAGEVVSCERGAVSASRRLRKVYAGKNILLGDASGSVDAITGEGLRLCFEQSLALADALADGNLAGYQKAHEKIARRPGFMAAQLLLMDRWPWLQRRVLRVLAAKPEIFKTQLAMHVGAASMGEFVMHSMIPLVGSLLTS